MEEKQLTRCQTVDCVWQLVKDNDILIATIKSYNIHMV